MVRTKIFKFNWHPPKKPVENVASFLKRKEKQTQKVSDIDAFKIKTSNLQTKHKHFERELNSNMISNFVQCNLKSHPSRPNVSKPHKNQTQSQFTKLI